MIETFQTGIQAVTNVDTAMRFLVIVVVAVTCYHLGKRSASKR